MTGTPPAAAAAPRADRHTSDPPSRPAAAVSRRAKIVSTLGPATHSYEKVRSLVEAGMDVARLNFSHGSHEDHARAYHWVRQAAEETGRGVAVLVDLQGPEIRLGRFADGPVLWGTGETVTITTEPCAGDHDRVSTTYAGLASDVAPGDPVLVDDGRVALRVLAVEGPEVRLEVTEGGRVTDSKGLSLPTGGVGVPALSDKDEADLRFGLTLGADLVALSFVRSPSDVGGVHRIMDDLSLRRPVLAKLEKPQAVAALDAVVEAFDGLMVARGDLGVEMPLERVPLVQKRAVQVARELAKPVIVATQMLESMIDASRPTRAEASDVANAVLDVSSIPGSRTLAGLRNNVDVGVQYLEAWLRGNGAVGIHNLMEDAATAEISRSQIWQWVHNGVVLESGEKVTPELVRRILDEELAALRQQVGEGWAERRYEQARDVFEQVALADEFADFLTLPAYEVVA